MIYKAGSDGLEVGSISAEMTLSSLKKLWSSSTMFGMAQCVRSADENNIAPTQYQISNLNNHTLSSQAHHFPLLPCKCHSQFRL